MMIIDDKSKIVLGEDTNDNDDDDDDDKER